MKRIIISLIAISFLLNAKAQEYSRFKLGLHSGFVLPEGGGGGFIMAIEPAFRISDQILIGVKGEVSIFTREFDQSQQTADNIDIGVGGIGAYTAHGQFYFLNGPFRPFVGLGLGMYLPAEVSIKSSANIAGASASNEQTVSPNAAFGFYPRIGFDLGHFNFVFDYNVVADSRADVVRVETQNVNGSTTITQVERETIFKNSYWGIKLGFSIGGGR